MAYSIYPIAAMLGCMRWESSLNPTVWESHVAQNWNTMHYYVDGVGYGGFGLGQWTNTGSGEGMRLERMHDWMVANNKDIYNGNDQIEYMLYEIYQGQVGGVWYNSWHTGSNAQTLHEFLETSSTDLDGLTADFLANWEGVPNNRLAERRQYAHEILDYIRAHINDDPSQLQWQISSDWTLPVSETLNNALCVYFFLQGYDPGPGPGPTPGKSKKMPLWMYLKRIPF